MKRLQWRPMALSDREAIMVYIAHDNPKASIDLDLEFEAKAESARKSPTLYRPGRVKDTRAIVVRPNYVMIYQVSGVLSALSLAGRAMPQACPFARHKQSSGLFESGLSPRAGGARTACSAARWT